MTTHADRVRAHAIHELANPAFEKGALTRFFRNTDPITGIEMVELYTEDGRGNGILIFAARASEFVRFIADEADKIHS